MQNLESFSVVGFCEDQAALQRKLGGLAGIKAGPIVAFENAGKPSVLSVRNEMAREVLEPMTDPQFISLRQTLAQEISALRALPADPRDEAAGELDALEATLPRLSSRAPGAPPAAAEGGSRWQRILDALVQVRPSSSQDLISPADRATGEATLALELALARTALERRDEAAFRASLTRIDQWLQRLYADDATLRERRERLRALAGRTLSPALPDAGAALQQLRDLRRGRDATP